MAAYETLPPDSADSPAPGARRRSHLVFGLMVFAVTSVAAWTLFALSDARIGRRGDESALADHRPRNLAQLPTLGDSERLRIRIFREACPSVVHIRTERDAVRALTDGLPFPGDPTQVPPGSGSGFVWSVRGYVVTNAHLIAGRNEAWVTMCDGSEWPAAYVGHSDRADLAVLAIGAPRELMRPLPIGDSQALEVGRGVLAIGNPYGLDATLSTGVVSGLGRSVVTENKIVLSDLIQTDADIHPGNSGGPLLNSAGQLVGLNTAVATSHGGNTVGFAIPAHIVNQEVPRLIRAGIEPRFELGLHLGSDEKCRPFLDAVGLQGVVPFEVTGGGPAARAGVCPAMIGPNIFQLQDVIVAVDGQPVSSRDELDVRLHEHDADKPLHLTLARLSSSFRIWSSESGNHFEVLSQGPGIETHEVRLRLE